MKYADTFRPIDAAVLAHAHTPVSLLPHNIAVPAVADLARSRSNKLAEKAVAYLEENFTSLPDAHKSLVVVFEHFWLSEVLPDDTFHKITSKGLDANEYMMRSVWRLNQPVSLGEVVIAGLTIESWLEGEDEHNEMVTVGRVAQVLSVARRQFFGAMDDEKVDMLERATLAEKLFGNRLSSMDTFGLDKKLRLEMIEKQHNKSKYEPNEEFLDKNALLWLWLGGTLAELSNADLMTTPYSFDVLAGKVGFDVVLRHLAEKHTDPVVVEALAVHGVDDQLMQAVIEG